MKNKAVYLIIILFSFTSCLPRHEVIRSTDNRQADGRPADNRQADNRVAAAEPPRTGASTTSPATLRPGTSLAGINYIERYRNIALEEMERHGIPASIKLAQGLLESGNGSSRLAREANNHFGIKCAGDWVGGRIFHDDDEENDCFRVYQHAEESFRDHSQFLLRRRYEKLFALDKRDYRAWAAGLKEAGYATNPRYAELLVDLIERYELYQYDQMGGMRFAASHPEIEKPKAIESKPIENTRRENTHRESAGAQTVNKTPVTMKIHEVMGGETAATIASRYGITLQELLTINGLRSQELHRGQLLIVSKPD